MNAALVELYRHKTRAMLRLIEHCRALDDEYPDASIPGTYGPIRDTLRHLVDADLPTREVAADDGVRMPGAVTMAQAIHHADDHRGNVLSILGARGLEVPRLDVWSYARSQDQLSEPTRPSRD